MMAERFIGQPRECIIPGSCQLLSDLWPCSCNTVYRLSKYTISFPCFGKALAHKKLARKSASQGLQAFHAGGKAKIHLLKTRAKIETVAATSFSCHASLKAQLCRQMGFAQNDLQPSFLSAAVVGSMASAPTRKSQKPTGLCRA